jgi:hypothetical protein
MITKKDESAAQGLILAEVIGRYQNVLPSRWVKRAMEQPSRRGRQTTSGWHTQLLQIPKDVSRDLNEDLGVSWTKLATGSLKEGSSNSSWGRTETPSYEIEYEIPVACKEHVFDWAGPLMVSGPGSIQSSRSCSAAHLLSSPSGDL